MDDTTDDLVPALDAAASTRLGHIPDEDVAAVVKRVLKRDKKRTVEVAMFGSAI